MKGNKTLTRGMSLAEIMMAIGIISLIVVSLITTLIGGFYALQKGIAYQEAIIIAKKTVGNYKAMEYDAIPVYEPPLVTEENGFNVKVGIIEAPYPSTKLKYKQLTVTVFRDGQSGKKVRVNMATYIYPYD